MRVLMLAWELPPLFSGGLGIACQGLLGALRLGGVDVTCIVPWSVPGLASGPGDVIGAFGAIQPGELPRYTADGYSLSCDPDRRGGPYVGDVPEMVWRFAERVRQIAADIDFDIIHAHDWTTSRAGIAAGQVSGKPLVLQLHSIEYDRASAGPDPQICALEKEGIFSADRVIAVSEYARAQIVYNYDIDSGSVDIVYNGTDEIKCSPPYSIRVERRPATVLFAGRLTAQKGPHYFLLAAEVVLRSAPDTRFIVAGEGDLRGDLENIAVGLGIGDSVNFAGFLSRFDLERVYDRADVCVMTSISEPFGIVALEAAVRGIPLIVPPHAGVTEVLQHCMRVDPWDTERVAGSILDIINNRNSLADDLSQIAIREARALTWERAALRIMEIYRELGVEA